MCRPPSHITGTSKKTGIDVNTAFYAFITCVTVLEFRCCCRASNSVTVLDNRVQNALSYHYSSHFCLPCSPSRTAMVFVVERHDPNLCPYSGKGCKAVHWSMLAAYVHRRAWNFTNKVGVG